jgi:prepilin-type N-terminal cleavage/methylation domain-containing protein
MRNQRGFTLVELLVVLLIMLVVTGGIYRLLNNTQRVTRAQAERIDLQSNVRSASIIIPNELREINTVVGAGAGTQVDILNKSATSITYRAMRAMGFVCTGTTASQLRLSNFTGLQTTVTALQDSAYVFNDGAKTEIGSDDSWKSVRITGVSTLNTCAAGVPAMTLNLDVGALAAAPNALAGAPNIGAPVRIFEVMELGLYANNGQSWLGIRSVSHGEAALQPLLGPLRDGDGLQFTYLDANGAVTATEANIKSILVTVNGVSNLAVSSAGNAKNTIVSDQVITQVALRNALR